MSEHHSYGEQGCVLESASSVTIGHRALCSEGSVPVAQRKTAMQWLPGRSIPQGRWALPLQAGVAGRSMALCWEV